MVDNAFDVTMRPASASDADQIARVHVASWREAYSGVVAPAYLADLDEAARAERWRDQLSGGGYGGLRVWVAEEAEHVLGFAALGPSRDEDADRTTLEIYSIYLEPDAWGHGVARELMRTVLSGVPHGVVVTLWVLAANERARHFYRRHGFVPDGTERLEQIGEQTYQELRYRRG